MQASNLQPNNHKKNFQQAHCFSEISKQASCFSDICKQTLTNRTSTLLLLDMQASNLQPKIISNKICKQGSCFSAEICKQTGCNQKITKRISNEKLLWVNIWQTQLGWRLKLVKMLISWGGVRCRWREITSFSTVYFQMWKYNLKIEMVLMLQGGCGRCRWNWLFPTVCLKWAKMVMWQEGVVGAG